jgi:hypothetical protein
MKQLDTKIEVGSLVELIRDFSMVEGWKIGDIAKVIEVDETSIPYRIQIEKQTTWCVADDVKLCVPKETVVIAEVLPQLKYKVGDRVKVLTDRSGEAAWCTYGEVVSIYKVDDADTRFPYLVCQLENTYIDECYFIWLSQDDVELYVPEVKEQTEEVFFKTQQEIWKYLSEDEEHVVVDIDGANKTQFKNGQLTTAWFFTRPEEWKPYIAPEHKDWWELVPEGKEVLCWYGDELSEKTGKPFLFGKVYRYGDEFTTGSSLTWEYAIPATLEEAKQYILSEILANEESN